MSKKRYRVDTFIEDYPCGFKDLEDNTCEVFCDDNRMTYREVVDKLNKLHEEKEKWKANCCNETNQNQILWNEIHNLRKQGAKYSPAFQEYLNSILTEYDKFWQRKIKQARNDKVI